MTPFLEWPVRLGLAIFQTLTEFLRIATKAEQGPRVLQEMRCRARIEYRQ